MTGRRQTGLYQQLGDTTKRAKQRQAALFRQLGVLSGLTCSDRG